MDEKDPPSCSCFVNSCIALGRHLIFRVNESKRQALSFSNIFSVLVKQVISPSISQKYENCNLKIGKWQLHTLAHYLKVS